MQSQTLTVEGMKCGGCVAAVREALEAIDGVRDVDVSLEDGRATVSAGEAVPRARLIAAVEHAGYRAM